MANIRFRILAGDQNNAQLDELAKSLEQHGLHIEQTHPRFRTIYAVGDRSLLETLRSVEGVESVREEPTFKLPPLDENEPQ